MKQFRFDYTVPVNSFPAFCDVRIYECGSYGRQRVIILTELPDNTGMSVTNACEYIATELVRLHNLTPGYTIWIEHYPDRHPAGMEKDRMFDESFALITFEWNGNRACSPDWRCVSREWAEQLIRETL
jgi:hypothetical protein